MAINTNISQELFSVLGLQLSKGLNNLDFDTIIHQCRNIVNNNFKIIDKNKSNNLIYFGKNKSQKSFSVLRLQFPQGLNNLDFDTIIHQCRNIVNSKKS